MYLIGENGGREVGRERGKGESGAGTEVATALNSAVYHILTSIN